MPTIGKVSPKTYKCDHCGEVFTVATNHYGAIYSACPNRACKSRPPQSPFWPRHQCMDPLPPGWERPPEWSPVRLGDILCHEPELDKLLRRLSTYGIELDKSRLDPNRAILTPEQETSIAVEYGWNAVVAYYTPSDPRLAKTARMWAVSVIGPEGQQRVEHVQPGWVFRHPVLDALWSLGAVTTDPSEPALVDICTFQVGTGKCPHGYSAEIVAYLQ